MTFKEFAAWCNQRACDGCWGMSDAVCCIDIVRKIRMEPFWKREKLWKTKYKDWMMENIVNPIEAKMKEMEG